MFSVMEMPVKKPKMKLRYGDQLLNMNPALRSAGPHMFSNKHRGLAVMVTSEQVGWRLETCSSTEEHTV